MNLYYFQMMPQLVFLIFIHSFIHSHFCFRYRVSLYSIGCPGTCVDQFGLKITAIPLPWPGCWDQSCVPLLLALIFINLKLIFMVNIQRNVFYYNILKRMSHTSCYICSPPPLALLYLGLFPVTNSSNFDFFSHRFRSPLFTPLFPLITLL